MGGHDYGHPRYGGVEVAVKEFAAREQVEIRTAGSCWWAVKPDTLVAAADSGSLPSLDMGVQTFLR
jgi:hypothetical protein